MVLARVRLRICNMFCVRHTMFYAPSIYCLTCRRFVVPSIGNFVLRHANLQTSRTHTQQTTGDNPHPPQRFTVISSLPTPPAPVCTTSSDPEGIAIPMRSYKFHYCTHLICAAPTRPTLPLRTLRSSHRGEKAVNLDKGTHCFMIMKRSKYNKICDKGGNCSL